MVSWEEIKNPVIVGLIIATAQSVLTFLLEILRDRGNKKRDEKIEKLEKKLEEKEGKITKLAIQYKDYEKIKRSELGEIVDKFKKLHIDNSTPKTNNRDSEEWRRWSFLKINQREEYYKSFFEELSRIMNKVQMGDDESSFIGNCCHTFHNPDDNSPGPETYEYLKWGYYKKILGKSTSTSNYFKNLNDNVNSWNSCCKHLLFSVTKIDLLLLKVFDY